MQLLKSIDNANATGKTKQIFDSLQQSLGTVPNLVRVLANSPAAVNAYANFSGALAHGSLPARLREELAMAVASTNGCDYCLSAHTVLGGLAGLDRNALSQAQQGSAQDHKEAAALQFAVKVVKARGILPTSEIETLRAAGYTDGDIAEIISHVALNIFTNYFNNLVGTEIDFPVIHTQKVTAADSRNEKA